MSHYLTSSEWIVAASRCSRMIHWYTNSAGVICQFVIIGHGGFVVARQLLPQLTNLGCQQNPALEAWFFHPWKCQGDHQQAEQEILPKVAQAVPRLHNKKLNVYLYFSRKRWAFTLSKSHSLPNDLRLSMKGYYKVHHKARHPAGLGGELLEIIQQR